MTDAAQEVKALLAQLVAVDSTSSRPNGPVLDVIEARLSEDGFTCTRQPYLDAGGVKKENLVARSAGLGADQRAELALVGHTDCVPFDPGWAEALALTERGSRLYGRGACDTKGFIACALAACRSVGAARLARPVVLLFTADEEVGCVGAKRLVEASLGRARFAIVGEPTSLRPIRANKGYCMAEVEVLGREGHSAYPDLGASAVFRAARLLRKLEAFAKGPLRERVNVHFDPPFTTLNVGMISGGKAKNVIPGSCRFTVEWRPIPTDPVDGVAVAIQELLKECEAEEPGFSARLAVQRLDAGVETHEESELVRFLSAETGQPPGTVAFGTEAPQLTELGAEAVVFGPGDIRVAHQTGEFVPVADLIQCHTVLERALLRFAGSP